MTDQEYTQESYSYIFRALSIAARYHRMQTRKSDNYPYINHLIDSAEILINKGSVDDENEIAAAILHDILEDTDISISTLMEHFNSLTIFILLLLTEDKSLSIEERRIATLRKLHHATDEVKRVKLADLCSNADQSPKGWCKKRLSEYYEYTDKLAEECKNASPSLYSEYSRRRNYKNDKKNN